MSKSSLIIDTPKYCYLCSCYAEYDDVGYCQGITAKIVPTEGKPSWCPLKPYKKVDAIPIEWIEEWGWKNGMSESMSLRVMIEDWEKENADL